MIRLVLADDQPLFVQNLKIVIEARADDMTVVGIAGDGKTAISEVESTKPDLILMDVRMPVLDGVEAARQIHRRFPAVKIVMLTTFDNDEYVTNALRHGAIGYVLKSVMPDELLTVIRSAIAGTSTMSEGILQRVVSSTDQRRLGRVGRVERKDDAISLYRSLTRREQEVISLVARAYSNRDIASELGMAEQTVKNHLTRVYDKVGVFRRTELMRAFRDFDAEDFQPHDPTTDK